MKLPSLLLSLFIVCGMSTAHAQGPYSNAGSSESDSQSKRYTMKSDQQYGNAEHQAHDSQDQASKNEMYCELHDEYHHHHKNGRLTHSHADGKTRHQHSRPASNVYHGYGQKKRAVSPANLD